MQTSPIKTEGQYWDKEAYGRVAQKPGERVVISDNFKKRKEILRRLLSYEMLDKEILEIGCGLATLFCALGACTGIKGYKATDTSKVFCEVSNKLWGVETHQAKANKLPFKDKSFDYIFLFDVLEHIKPIERDDSYSEMDRVVKDEGIVFINNPLNESHHDKDFDFGFSDKDIWTMVAKLRMKINVIDKYTITLFPRASNGKIIPVEDRKSELYSYQWVVMSR